jgi:hypothetical protein
MAPFFQAYFSPKPALALWQLGQYLHKSHVKGYPKLPKFGGLNCDADFSKWSIANSNSVPHWWPVHSWRQRIGEQCSVQVLANRIRPMERVQCFRRPAAPQPAASAFGVHHVRDLAAHWEGNSMRVSADGTCGTPNDHQAARAGRAHRALSTRLRVSIASPLI